MSDDRDQGRILQHRCERCDATNPTRSSDPPPARCAICGSVLRVPPAWEGKPAFTYSGDPRR